MALRRKTGLAIIIAAPLIGAGCSHSPADALVHRYVDSNSPAHVLVCRDYGCSVRMWVGLSDAEWAEIRAIFANAASTPAEEREQMRSAIARIEQMVGPKAGTSDDDAGAAIINFNKRGQLDCIDEAYNTTTYLRFMATDGLIRHHEVGEPAKRGYILNRWPHNTATVIERGTGDAYVIDSWFGANGELPDVVTLEVWMEGWEPEGSA